MRMDSLSEKRMPKRSRPERLLLRLRWLERLRWFAAGGLVALTLGARFVLELRLAWRPLLLLAGAVVAYNVVFGLVRTHLQAKPRGSLTREKIKLFANLQIGLDMVLLTLVLHFSGGVENPFVVIYLLHPITASILFTPRSAYVHASLATLLFLLMCICEAAWPGLHHPVGGYLDGDMFRRPLVIGAAVGALAVSVHLAVYLVSTIARSLHQREAQLHDATDALELRSSELAQANEELRQIEERKSRFLSLAAHQLRGPLAATEGCLALVCDGYASDPAKRAELLSRARARIQGMLQIVRDLLTLAGAHELTEAATARRAVLDEVAQRVIEQYSDFAASRQIALVFHPGAHRAEVSMNDRALADALGNLVSNAIKYTEEGGHVKVATRAVRSEAICEVIDDGIGIPEAEQENLFKDFFRAANARISGQEGTGLGLSIVKEIAEKHGGSVKIESLENLGTCAAFTVPLATGPQDHPGTAAQRANGRGSGGCDSSDAAAS